MIHARGLGSKPLVQVLCLWSSKSTSFKHRVNVGKELVD